MRDPAGADDPIVSSGSEAPRLTSQERAALTISATGLEVVEVAEVLGLPPAEVRRLLTSAITKLAARSKLEAVLIAARRRLIDLPER